jgi:S1-C subfamily serine protease
MRALAALLLATVALPAAALAQSGDGASFRVVNRTGEVAIGLYAADPGQEGRNLIAGRAMRPGQSAQITRPSPGCVVDVRLVTAGGGVFYRRGADICATPEIAFTADAAAPQLGAGAGMAAVQRALGALGYDTGGADGQIGPRTQAAIAAFQRDRNLPATGLLDGETLAALRAARPEGGEARSFGGQATQPVVAGKPPPAAGPDRPEPIPGGRVAALPAPTQPPPVAGAKPPPAAGATPPNVAPRPQAGQRRASTGTGFIVGEGRVLTNHHVVESCASVVGLLANGNRVTFAIQAAERERDLALLVAPRNIGPVLAFRSTPPRRGDEVVTYGFPLTGILGSGPTLTTGEVSALTGLRDDPNTMIISAPVQAGNSGGPLLDRSGNVLGVIVAKLNALRVAERTGGDLPQNVNFAIQGRVALEFLRRNGVTPRTAESAGNRAAAEVGEIAHPSTVLIECMR